MTAVAVGDGACSIVSNGTCTGVVDCGWYMGSPVAAAARLAAALRGRAPLLDALVVSHFDTDHWEGFTGLASALGAPLSLPGLKVYVPHMPPQLPAAVWAFLTPRSQDGAIASVLRRCLLPLVTSSSTLDVVPCAAGDVVTVGGLEMDGLPPEVWTP